MHRISLMMLRLVILSVKNTFGEVLEWLKRHAWKACNRQNRFAGSNPVLSAFNNKGDLLGFLFLYPPGLYQDILNTLLEGYGRMSIEAT